MIELTDLTKKFGNITAIQNLNLTIKKGEVFGLLGPNGAGKTTTTRLISTLLKPTSGTIKINNENVTEKPEEIRKKIGLLPENTGLYNNLTLMENLEFNGELNGLSNQETRKKAKEYLTQLNLWSRRNDKVGTFSKGMKQKTAIIRALIHEPEIILLDEPTANLDPVAAKKVREFILELKNKKRIIILNTHNLPEAQRLCTRVALINNELIKVGSPNELRKKLFKNKIKVTVKKVKKTKLGLKNYDYQVKKNQVIITVNNPSKDNPLIIKQLMKHHEVIYVESEQQSLEDIYLKLLKEGQ